MRSTRRCGATLLLPFVLACVAYGEPLRERYPSFDAQAATPLFPFKLFVRRPAITDPRPAPLPFLSPAEVLEWRMEDTAKAVGALVAAHLFPDVVLVDARPSDPGAYVEVLPPVPTPRCDGDEIMVPFLTVGLLPATCTRDTGFRLHVLDASLPDLTCSWLQTEMVGLLPVAVATRWGGYTRAPAHNAYLAFLRDCVSQQADALTFAAGRR